MAKNRKSKKGFLTKPLDKKTFRKEMRAAIRQEFGAAQRDLQKERRISRATQRRNADYFGEYQDQLAQMQRQNQAQTQTALNQMGGFANQMVGQNQDIAQQVNQNNQASAATRGASVGPTQNNQAVAGLVGQGTQIAGQIASQGQAQTQYLGAQETAAIQQKNEMRKQQQLVRRTVREELRQLKKDKGAAKSMFKAQAREGERNYDLARRELRQGKMALKQGRVQSNKSNKLQREQARKDRKLERKQAEKDRKAGKGEGESGGRTKTNINSEVSKAMGALNESPPPAGKRNFKTIMRTLQQAGYSPLAARRAARRWLKLKKKDPAGNVGEGVGGVGEAIGNWGKGKKKNK